LGLIVCHRGGMRTASEYRLTWFENHDGAPATNEWRAYRSANLAPLPRARIRKSGTQSGSMAATDIGSRSVKSATQRGSRSGGQSAFTDGSALKRDLSQGSSSYLADGARPAKPAASTVVPLRQRRRSRPRPNPAPDPYPGKDHHR
jgi:hypothetical protein